MAASSPTSCSISFPLRSESRSFLIALAEQGRKRQGMGSWVWTRREARRSGREAGKVLGEEVRQEVAAHLSLEIQPR